MRTAIASTTFLMSLGLSAQLWSPPGAIWNYNIQSPTHVGCQTRAYVGDTVIDGRSAQQFHVTGHVLNYVTSTITETDTYFHTSVEDSIVFAWTSLSGQWEWDTLYWFNALPGDRWWPIGVDENYCGGDGTWGMLQVTDTGQVSLSGVQLRTVSAVYLDQFGDPGISTITFGERLGTPTMAIAPGGCVSLGVWATTRTYQDDMFPLYDTGEPSPCDLFLGLDPGPRRLSGPVLYPNPGLDHFRVLLRDPVGNTMVRMHDIAGRNVLEHALQGDRTVDASALPTGIYLCTIMDPNGLPLGTATWIKN